jgi:ABC-type arginine transport system permease subunit
MISAVILAAFSGTIAAAQSSIVIDLMLPAVDPQPLVASVISVGPAVTTYAVECADEAKEASECGLPHATTVAQGPSTWSIHYSHSDAEFGS